MAAPATAAAPDPPARRATTNLHPPASLTQIFKLTRYQLREYLSSFRFFVLIGIVVAIGVILTAIVAYFRHGAEVTSLLSSPLSFYASFWGGATNIVIVLAAVFFGGDAIAGEFQNKTGYFLMGLPIRRATVYVGKFIAALAASIGVLLLFLVLLLLNGAYYFGGGLFPWELGVSVVLAIVYLTAVLGATFMFSSLFKTSAYGFVLTAILFLFGFSLLQDLVQGLIKIEPWMVISYASPVIGNVLSPPTNWGLSGTIVTTSFGPASITSYTPGIAEGVVIMLVYFFLTSIAGLYLFEREEFS